MCLGIPGRIVEIYEQSGTQMGKVDFEGILKEICLTFTPEAEVGNYVIVHVGFAITMVDEESAHETLALMREMGVLAGELDADVALAEEEAIARGEDPA
jgi:hydrogenase expression/formation protein HypC